MRRYARFWPARIAAVLTFLFCGCGGGGISSPTPPSSQPPLPSEVITISTPSIIQGVLTEAFNVTLQAQGASGPVTWSVISGQLPTGLSLDAGTGVISGTPTANQGNVTIQAADSKTSGSKVFSFELWTKLIINPVSPSPAHLSAPYSLTVTASYAIAKWTITSGTLPSGLTLTAHGGAALISGSASETGTFSFTLQAQDDTVPQTATIDLSIVVDTHLAIAKASLIDGRQNKPYSDSFVVVNGTPPYTWSISGTLPAGLSLDSASGQVSGTPTAYATFAYTVSVADSSSPQQTDSGQGTLNIAMQLGIVGSLPPAYIGQLYIAPLVATGGYFPYSWTIASGSLPAGLSLAPSGTISGTPSQLGSSAFVVQVTDSGDPPDAITQSFTLSVQPAPLTLAANPLSPAPVNVLYHSQIPIAGGTPPYSWSISSGQLPPGLSLDPASGFIDGTPTQVGTFNSLVQGTDSGSPPQISKLNVFIQIRPRLGRNDSIATATPLGNSADQAPLVLSISPYIDPINASVANPDTDYYKLIASGGSLVHVETYAQRSWGADALDSVLEILDGNGTRLQACTAPGYTSPCLNDDIDSTTLDSALDMKAPGNAGTQTTFYVHVLDWRGDARPDMQYYLNISGVIDPLTISPSSLGAGATRGVSYQQQLTTSGGTGSVTWSLLSGSLPPGWSLSSVGLLSGVATTNGSYTFTILATDSANPPQTAQKAYIVQIADPIVITSPATWPNACLNQPYSFTIQTSGGLAPLNYGFYSGNWIAINLNQSTGTFSGVSSVLGTFTGQVGVGDSAQPPSQQTQTVSLTVVNCP